MHGIAQFLKKTFNYVHPTEPHQQLKQSSVFISNLIT